MAYKITTNSKYTGQFAIDDYYGSWVVMDDSIYFDNKSRAYVIAQCISCRTSTMVQCGHLKTEKSKQCSYCKHIGISSVGKSNPNYLLGKLPLIIRRRINSLGINITDEEAIELFDKQHGMCYVSDLLITLHNCIIGGSYNARLVPVNITKTKDKHNSIWVHKKYEKIFISNYSMKNLLDIKNTIEKLEERYG